MNKYKRLQQDLIKRGISALAVVFGFALLYFAASEFEAGGEKAKADAESTLARDKAQVANLKNQLTQSSTAEKQFVDISLEHENPDFEANNEAIKNWLRMAKTQYRFSNDFKLSITPEKPTDKTELSGLAYDVTIRPEMKLEFQAMSDMHVFSFIKDFVKQAPGVVRIDGLSLKRKGDMNNATLSQMNAGQLIFLVDANVKFSWIGISPKEGKAETPATQEQPK